LPVLLLAAASLLMGARCYPAGTRVVILMQGYYTSYDRNGTEATIVEGQRFNVLKNEFVAKGYARTSLLDFSYAGGGVTQDGTWRPNPYSCEITDRVSDDNLAPLETMLRDYGAHHQNAHFTLVGHSLGGYLAFVEGTREAGRTKAAKLGIDAVVTLDAALQGASPDKKLVLDIVPCQKTYLAGAEIVQQKLDPATPDLRRDQVHTMADQGIRVATYGNELDCFWNPAVCVPALPWVNDSGTQVLPDAAESHMYRITSVPLASHDAILADAGVGAAVVGFVGAP
jgi:pimeloyl-ACP methyl ester carboxylesterase